MRFRPCIDLHQGAVKQIVGGTLSAGSDPVTHFTSSHSAAYYAELYRADRLSGGHVIMLGPGSEDAASDALTAWPGGLQIGGGITAQNALAWLNRGASAVIVTSAIFDGPRLDWDRLSELRDRVGPERLVLDLSCRVHDGQYFVATNRWQTVTDASITPATLQKLSLYCSEFLVHAADIEGLREGPDEGLVQLLAESTPIPTTYAGGISSLEDILKVLEKGRGRVDFTVGAALDLFGGTGLRYRDLVERNRRGF